MKKVLAIILILALVFALGACSSTPNPASATEGESDGKGTSVVDDNPFNLDYESAEVQEMSSERLPQATLKEFYDYFVGLGAAGRENLTYADMVEHIGCEASEFSFTSGYRIYVWRAEENDFAQMNASIPGNNGVWKNPFMSAYNLGTT